jgi:L-malate glycosyltransferase
MRILHTVQAYAPYVGGSEELVRKLSEGLSALGHSVTVFTSYHEKRDFELLNGVRVRQFKVRGNLVSGIKGNTWDYVRAVKNEKVDIMLNYAAQTWATDALLPHLDTLRSQKVIAPCGYSGLRDPKYKEYFRTLPGYLNKYDSVVYHSQCYQDKEFGDRCGLEKKGVVIHNFADETEFEAAGVDVRQKYGLGDGPIFVTVANHFRAKGHSFVIDAFLRSKIENAMLLIIGNPYNPLNIISDCTLHCRMHGFLHNKCIRILEGIPRIDVVSALKAASVFLFGSEVECSPLVIFEAMASRTAWISTRVGNIGELPGGLMVGTSSEMVGAIRQLSSDNRLRDSLAETGYQEWKKRFTLTAMVNRYERLYMGLSGVALS